VGGKLQRHRHRSNKVRVVRELFSKGLVHTQQYVEQTSVRDDLTETNDQMLTPLPQDIQCEITMSELDTVHVDKDNINVQDVNNVSVKI